jgi:hypothetical protein
MPKTVAADDDDLIVELEGAQDDFAPQEDEVVEDFHQPPGLEAGSVPEGEEEDLDAVEDPDAQSRDERREATVDEVDAAEVYARIAASEERERQANARVIYTQAEAEARVVDQQRNSIKVGIDALKVRMDVAEKLLDQAEEAGDRAAVRQVQSDIADMKALRSELEQASHQLADPQAILNEGRNRANAALANQAQGRKVGNGIQARHPLAERWAAANGWMQTNGAANRDVISFSNALVREGYDPNSPGFYAELGRRVSNVHPRLKVQSLQAQRRGPGKAQMAGPVAGARSSTGSGAANRSNGGIGVARSANGKTKITISVAEQKKMQTMKLDPKNPVHARKWAEVRRESAARERQLGR